MAEQPDDDKNRMISLAEAADLYGFSRYYLSNLAKKGRLKATKVAATWVTTPNDIEVYIKSRKQMGVYRDDIKVD